MAGSFSKINYYLRPNKQVERKILLDILLHFRKFLNLNQYTYVGMGSVYYYDFILVHKFLGLKKLISFDSAKTIKRLEYNKPYDFIKFVPKFSTDYLSEHNWKDQNTIVWLDYDGSFYNSSDSIIDDIKLLARNCNDNDIVFLTINTTAPLGVNKKKDFLEKYEKYISPAYNNVTWVTQEKFAYLIQNIMHNVFVNENLFHANKYSKLCSFLYKDQAEMFTLGGFFTSDPATLTTVQSMHEYISFDEHAIHSILIPHITYKEKHYLDNNIDKIKKWYSDYNDLTALDEPDVTLRPAILEEMLNKEMDFELDPEQISNYIKHYRFMPQYFEGII